MEIKEKDILTAEEAAEMLGMKKGLFNLGLETRVCLAKNKW
ncbi:hypothetical protein [Listeria monocytogenes]|nr:hypothetical protein [Listeria monocytogenes]